MHDLIIRQTHMTIPVGTIYCLGKNFEKHIREMGGTEPTFPVIFIKPRTALVRPGGVIHRPAFSNEMHHEVELVTVIGKRGRNVPAEDAMEIVQGYAVGIDMTLRDVQTIAKQRGEPWAVAKGFDGSAPISDVLLRSEIGDPQSLTLRLSVNGQVRQEGTTGDMILSVPRVIHYLSTIFTLEPGDCVYTGTPEGVGPVEPGDTVRAEIVGHIAAEWSVA